MRRNLKMNSIGSKLTAMSSVLVLAVSAAAQSAERAAFVANDGNLQGSVTSFTFNADGSLNLVDFVITGETVSGGFHPGTNAYVIGINPSGEFLAVGHATGNPPAGSPQGRQLTILRVSSDATMNIHGTFLIQPTPLDLLWLDDEHIAVTQTNFGGINRVWVYHFDWETNQLIQKDAELTGSFTVADKPYDAPVSVKITHLDVGVGGSYARRIQRGARPTSIVSPGHGPTRQQVSRRSSAIRAARS
jgi:hypothetical protein